MSSEDAQKVALSDEYDIDKVVYSLDSIAPISGHSYGNLGGDVVGLGIYEAGGIWQDHNRVVAFSGVTIQPSTLANLLCSPTTTIFDATVHSKFVLLALPNNTYNTENFYQQKTEWITSTDAYMKIVMDTSFSRTTTAPETRTVAHNLGYVPMVNVWMKKDGYTTRLHGELNNSSTGTAVMLDETNLYISTFNDVPAKDITVFIRVYKENQDG